MRIPSMYICTLVVSAAMITAAPLPFAQVSSVQHDCVSTDHDIQLHSNLNRKRFRLSDFIRSHGRARISTFKFGTSPFQSGSILSGRPSAVIPSRSAPSRRALSSTPQAIL
ncbi:hypothetical protein BXZ70DRAFT_703605 [Cristinia sonorae]|uniref:Uncharacterized protein n=1 Tax=Cristinia sonorae TaxID=1940300 RepID=A0A8K0UD69_9AGAR|nr:hypothetical protein BXZ70DRAFT_703605 [Cristinia sonorae]